MTKPDPHEVLGVPRGAGVGTIKAAWRRLARENHPDLAADERARRASTRRMAEINAAYQVLTKGGKPTPGVGRSAGGGVRPPFGASGFADAETTSGGAKGGHYGRGRPSGPPPPPPSRPVTVRLDTSEVFRPRSGTSTVPGDGRAHPPGQPPIRARAADPEEPRASDPTGPLEQLRARRPGRVRLPALGAARAQRLEFGKFHGHSLGEVETFEPSYIDWIVRTIRRDPDLVAAARAVQAELDRSGVVRIVRPATPEPRSPEPAVPE